MKTALTAILALFIASAGLSQQNQRVYQSMNGKLGLSIYWGDTLVNMGSNKVNMVLRHDTRELILRFDPSTLYANNDSLNHLVKTEAFRDIEFNGEIDRAYIDLESQNNDAFTVSGDLTINGITKRIDVEVNMLHWSEQNMGITHMMKIHYHVYLDDFGLRDHIPGMAEFACIEIMQPLLRPAGQY